MKEFLSARKTSVAVALFASTALSSIPAQNPPVKLTQTIPLPGVEGRIDHFALDAVGNRLFVAALGNNTVEVLDLRNGERVKSISGLGSPQGIAFVPEFNRLFVANDQRGICRIYDGTSLQQSAEITLGDDADNVRYDAVAKRVYIGFGNGGLSIINPLDGKQSGSIKLSAHPESFQLETSGKRIFVNVPNARHVAVVDQDQQKVVATWKTDLSFANFPMALDETNHRLFVGCRMPPRLVVLNTDSGEVATKIAISGDTDDIFYDSKRHRIYVVCGAGKIDVIEQKDANDYQPVAKIDTAAGARTGMFVPQLDTLFVAVPHRGSQRAEIRAYHAD